MMSAVELELRKQRRTDYNVTVAVSGSAYTSGNVIGGLITIDNSNTVQGPNQQSLSSILQGVCLYDPTGQSAAIDLFFFNTKPAGTYADSTAFAPSSADMLSCIGVAQIANADYVALGASNGTFAGGKNQSNLAKVMKSAGLNTAIYCVPVVRATPTYTTLTLSYRFQFSHGY